MTRVRCEACIRLEALCLCHAVERIENRVKVLFLQHPLETHQVKNTARLTFACLNNAQWQVGEQFDEIDLQHWLSDRSYYLLYPQAPEEDVSVFLPEELHPFDLPEIGLVVLDGTWRKTRKMLFLNPLLAKLPRLQIHLDGVSNYEIRKQKNEQSFSTLEAVQQAMIELEKNAEKFKPLACVLRALIEQQKCLVAKGKSG